MKKEFTLLFGTIVIIFLLFLPHLEKFPYPPGGKYSDFEITHYPNAVYIQQSLFKFGEIPYWSNTIFSGYPFFADPLSGLFYPGGWLFILMPQPFGLNLAVFAHLSFAFIGMYLFLRANQISSPGAMVGGLAFVGMPKFIAHYAAGHITLLFCAAWLPWLMYTEQNYLESRRSAFIYLQAMILAMLILADPRLSVFCIPFWIVYRVIFGKRYSRKTLPLSVDILISLGIAIILALPLLVSLFQFAGLSTRSSMVPEDNLVYSLPLERLLGFLLPFVNTTCEWVIYPGLIGIFPVLLIGFRKDLISRILFFLSCFAFSLLFSLGDAIPGANIFVQLPIINLVRVPSRIMFLGGFCFSVLAGIGGNQLVEGNKNGRQLFNHGVFSFCLVIAFLSIGIGFLLGEKAWLFSFSGLLWLLLVVLYFVGRERRWFLWKYGVIGLLIIECIIVDATTVSFVEKQRIIASKKEIITQLIDLNDTQPYRIYSPSYSISQSIAVDNGLELADGVNPMQLRSYWEFMQIATGVQSARYSVTIPPFENGDPETANEAAIPDAKLLGKINVKYLVSAYPIHSDGFVLLWNKENQYIYQNQYVFSRAWVATGLGGNEIPDPVINFKSANRVKIMAYGPARLMVSEIYYPGWHASIDGQPIPIQSEDGLTMTIDIPKGKHEVEFWFFPLVTILTWVISLFSMITILGVYLNGKRNNHR
ncbi:MAG TPA: YfhO family protein [Anaerolineaceae bacterium]